MTRKQKKTLRRIIVSAVLYVLLLVIGAEHRGWLGLALFLIPYAVIGWDVLWRAVRNISNGQVFDENFLLAVATVGAFGCGEYSEAVARYAAGEEKKGKGIDVVQTGYMLGERVLRFAKVVVGE